MFVEPLLQGVGAFLEILLRGVLYDSAPSRLLRVLMILEGVVSAGEYFIGLHHFPQRSGLGGLILPDLRRSLVLLRNHIGEASIGVHEYL